MQTDIRPIGELPDLNLATAKPDDEYCGKKCGRGCTHDEYQKAINTAQTLAHSLPGPWGARIWENLGWHHSVVLTLGGKTRHRGPLEEKKPENYIEIYPSKAGTNWGTNYWCGCRIAGRQFHCNAADPKRGLDTLTAKITETLLTEQDGLERLKKMICEEVQQND